MEKHRHDHDNRSGQKTIAGDTAPPGSPDLPDVEWLSTEELRKIIYDLLPRQAELERQNRELRQYQTELWRAKEQWEATFHAVPDLIMILDHQHRIVRANRAMAETLGVTAEGLEGKACHEVVHGTQVPPSFCPHAKLMLDGREHAAELFEERLSSFLSVSCSPLIDRDGRTIGSVHVARNITDRKKSEQTLAATVAELRKSNSETKALLTSARALLEHREFRESAKRIFDACKELIGATAGYIALLTPEGTENDVLFLDSGGLVCNVDPSLPMPVRGLRAEAYRTGKPVCENAFQGSNWTELLPEGHVCLENVMFSPLLLEGQAVGLLGLANKPGGFNDYDAQLAATFSEFSAIGLLNNRVLESLEHSEEQFRSVVQTASDAIVCIDGQGRVVLWNRGAERVFGYSSDEVIGKNLDFIVPERFRKAHSDAVLMALCGKGSKNFGGTRIVVALRKDSTEFPAELSIAAWVTKSGTFLTGIVRDITERRRAEEALQETLRELERSNAELQQFAYVASHDLQEPLRMVSSYVRLLERRYKGKLGADADDYIFFAVDGAIRMQKMITDLLIYARVGTRGKPFETVDCEILLEQVRTNFSLSIEDTKARITNDPLPTVVGDGTQLAQLFQNLIDNALKFRKNGSPVIHVSAEQKGSEWQFSVADNGIGIEPQYNERIFLIFQRLHGVGEYSGTGIGLAVCKKIVERHGGRIWVESEYGKGTTFFFTINERA